MSLFSVYNFISISTGRGAEGGGAVFSFQGRGCFFVCAPSPEKIGIHEEEDQEAGEEGQEEDEDEGEEGQEEDKEEEERQPREANCSMCI